MWSCECDLVRSPSLSFFPMEECVKKNRLTQAEDIEAARLLIHLSSAVSASAKTIHEEEEEEEDHHNHSSSNSYSVEWTTKGGAGADVSLWSSDEEEEEEIEDVLADIEDDERLRRRNKRYRYLEDLYSVTLPVGLGHGHVPSAAVTTGNKSNKLAENESHINILCLKVNLHG